MPYQDDSEAVQWLQDYWDYVQMVEHGNEPSLNEIGGWDGLAQAFMDEDIFNQTIGYISDDINASDPNSDAGQLLSRLKQLKERYTGMNKMKKSKEFWEREDCFDELSPDMQDEVRNLCMTLQVNDPIIEKREDGYYFLFSYYDGDPEFYFDKYNIQQDREGQFNYFKLDKMKKSQDIHSMIADIRKNNNSLKKDRVDLDMAQKQRKINKGRYTYSSINIECKGIVRTYENDSDSLYDVQSFIDESVQDYLDNTEVLSSMSTETVDTLRECDNGQEITLTYPLNINIKVGRY